MNGKWLENTFKNSDEATKWGLFENNELTLTGRSVKATPARHETTMSDAHDTTSCDLYFATVNAAVSRNTVCYAPKLMPFLV